MGMRKRATWAGLGIAVASVACSGLRMRGADSVKAGSEPPGDQLAMYQPSACQDASGAVAQRNTTIRLVQLASGNRVLIELTPGYDSLVVNNAFVDRGEISFQAVIKAQNGRMMLHDFRVPNDLNGPGRMSVTSSWREEKLEGGGFRGTYDRPLMTCALALAGPETEKPKPTEEEEEEKTEEAKPDGGAETTEIGTPEPRDKYGPNDMVAVEVQGKLVKAKVVQALEGGRYYIEYQTTPPSSEWVDKAKIRGKLPNP
jgi:hypothetical protein